MSEPITWITKNGKHIPIYADKVSDDEKKKSREIGQNEQEGSEKNGKKVAYADFEDIGDMCMEFYKRTGINVVGVPIMYNKEQVVQAFETLEDLQNKFSINKNADPSSFEDRLELRFCYGTVGGNPFTDEHEDAFMMGGLGVIYLNPKYRKCSVSDLNEMYAEGEKTHFHPKTTTYKDVFVHEAAHHMLDSWVWEKCNHDRAKFDEVHTWLTKGQYHNPANPNKVVYELDDKFKECREKLANNPEFKKMWGSSAVNLNELALASPEYSIGKWSISKYAAKNRHELVAEAFKDFYANGQNAKEYSKIIVFSIFGLK